VTAHLKFGYLYTAILFVILLIKVSVYLIEISDTV